MGMGHEGVAGWLELVEVGSFGVWNAHLVLKPLQKWGDQHMNNYVAVHQPR